jgi:hypothetical protein
MSHAGVESLPRTRGRRRVGTPVLVAALLGATGAVAQPSVDYEYEAPVALDRLLPESLIASGEHRVTRARQLSDHRLVFDIESDAAGALVAESIPLAVIRIQETQILAQALNQFRSANRAQAEDRRGEIRIGGDSMADIIGSPLDTSARVVGQFGRNVGQTFSELGEFPGPRDRESAPSAGVGEDPIFDAHRRNVASQLGLDVYSSNPSVRRFLDAMARARSGGQQRAGITTVALARAPEVLVGGGSVQERIRSTVLNEERSVLFERGASRLRDAGVSQDLVDRLLEHPVLTPTHKSAITEYLVYMEGVRNRGALVEASLDAGDEVQALGKVQLARMYAHYHESVDSLREFIAAGHLALAVSRDNTLLVALPFDVLQWTPETNRVFSGLAAFAGRKGARAHAVLLTGVVTDRAREALESMGFTLRPRFLFR